MSVRAQNSRTLTVFAASSLTDVFEEIGAAFETANPGVTDRDIEDAALVDGATPWWRFVYITVPLAGRALISGALTSWARALGEFGATILFAGSLQGRTQTMPLLIYSIFERNIDAAVWKVLILVELAGVIMVITLLLAQESPTPTW